jgi:hypothetical protein
MSPESISLDLDSLSGVLRNLSFKSTKLELCEEKHIDNTDKVSPE